jgi:plastocyanin domain-containing protein
MTKGKLAVLALLIILNIVAFFWNKQHDRILAIKAQGPQTIIINKHGFVPNRLVYKQGDVVSLIIHNQDDKTHNFVLADYYVFSPDLHKGETTRIQFTAVKKGNFSFVSDTPGYPELGYKGLLKVK